jgi:Xaa-Pro aminopeptidase
MTLSLAFSSEELLAEYRQRRAIFMAKLGQGTAIFRSAPTAVLHHDVTYNYRQDSDFFYLTGLAEAEAVAVFAPHHEEHQFILFVQPKDPEKETWSGYRVGVDKAQEYYGADAAFSLEELDEKLPNYLAKADRIYYHFGADQEFNGRILGHWQKQLRQFYRRGTGPVALEDAHFLLQDQRCIKSPLELAQMQKAMDLGIAAHQRALAMARPGLYEYEIQAEMEYIFRQGSVEGFAYPAIVASGANGCILHYTENTRRMEDGDLLLIDAGCSYGYYNSDITRTFPVGDRFSPEQRILYELVLEAQTQAIAAVQPGKPWNLFHDRAVEVLVDGLIELGLLVGDAQALIEEEKYKPFYMHRTGHWLGLDVHDAGLYKRGDEWLPFQAGQVVTVEPGIYIRPDFKPAEGQPEVPERWLGIGIRIEDDVLVTETGQQVLTEAVPKAIADLEYRH